jgi:hypothetical protein
MGRYRAKLITPPLGPHKDVNVSAMNDRMWALFGSMTTLCAEECKRNSNASPCRNPSIILEHWLAVLLSESKTNYQSHIKSHFRR